MEQSLRKIWFAKQQGWEQLSYADAQTLINNLKPTTENCTGKLRDAISDYNKVFEQAQLNQNQFDAGTWAYAEFSYGNDLSYSRYKYLQKLDASAPTIPVKELQSGWWVHATNYRGYVGVIKSREPVIGAMLGDLTYQNLATELRKFEEEIGLNVTFEVMRALLVDDNLLTIKKEHKLLDWQIEAVMNMYAALFLAETKRWAPSYVLTLLLLDMALSCKPYGKDKSLTLSKILWPDLKGVTRNEMLEKKNKLTIYTSHLGSGESEPSGMLGGKHPMTQQNAADQKAADSLRYGKSYAAVGNWLSYIRPDSMKYEVSKPDGMANESIDLLQELNKINLDWFKPYVP